MSCNEINPCTTCGETPKYDDCGCLDFPSFECVTYYGHTIPGLGIVKGANGEAVLLKIADAISNKQFTKVSTSQMNALVDMYSGDSVYNTTENKVAVYDGTSWRFLSFE